MDAIKATATVELALNAGDSWELIGDFASLAEAVAAADAMRFEATAGREEMVFGISTDPGSGHYESGYIRYADGSSRMTGAGYE